MGTAMGLTYFKRFRMEIPLAGRILPPVALPVGYHLIPWHPELLEEHAEVKYHSFHGEVDASVFPCFAERPGCLRLMQEIARKKGFLPQATWLAHYHGEGGQEYCGTIQGITDGARIGAIQNVGVTPCHRGRGIGSCLVLQSLAAFRAAGMQRAYLEVTARNSSAVRLYRRLGFVKVRTLYKAVEVAYT